MFSMCAACCLFWSEVLLLLLVLFVIELVFYSILATTDKVDCIIIYILHSTLNFCPCVLKPAHSTKVLVCMGYRYHLRKQANIIAKGQASSYRCLRCGGQARGIRIPSLALRNNGKLEPPFLVYFLPSILLSLPPSLPRNRQDTMSFFPSVPKNRTKPWQEKGSM